MKATDSECSPAVPSLSRRGFLQSAAAIAAGVAAAAATPTAAEAANPAALPTMPSDGPPNLLLRMQGDVQRAMRKPVAERRWAMAIDLRKCIGCSACTIACVAENKLPPGVVYRPVIEEEVGDYPHVSRRFIPRPCMQCENPPCVPVCPVKATYTRPDGIVEIDYKACIGCRYCITACPYGARTADFGEFYTDGTPKRQAYETQPSHEYGQTWMRDGKQSPAGNARKCHFCVHRLEAGMLPACVTTCVGYATFFGDMNDPESLIHEMAGKPNVMRLKEELGTKPRVFYLT
jgi:molybdopterin-containing oxidoreductase family iron-sulfur binding subunit